VLKKNKRRNVVEEQKWCQEGVGGGAMSRKNMNNIGEEQEQNNDDVEKEKE